MGTNFKKVQRVDFTFVRNNNNKNKKKNMNLTKKINCYWPDFDQTLNVGTWEPLEQILTVTVTFVQATFVQVTFVHIRNISAVTDPILMKLKW